MKSKWLIGAVVFLLISNIGTVFYFMTDSEGTTVAEKNSVLSSLSGNVAQVGNQSISNGEWVKRLKEQYGKEVLTQMVNKEVVSQLAEKHDITVSKEELKREIEMYHRMVGTSADAQEHPDIQKMDDGELKSEIKHSILLEELITKDVVIKEEELRKYYNENQNLYDLKPLYQISQIVVESREEAESVLQELENGSSFSTLARERSIDEFSAPSGGAMGWVDESSNYVDPAYLPKVKKMEKDKWTGPIKTEAGYGIVYLHDVKPGSKYEFEEVKDQIRRQLAIQQLDSDFDPKQLWDELKVTWEYGSD